MMFGEYGSQNPVFSVSRLHSDDVICQKKFLGDSVTITLQRRSVKDQRQGVFVGFKRNDKLNEPIEYVQ